MSKLGKIALHSIGLTLPLLFSSALVTIAPAAVIDPVDDEKLSTLTVRLSDEASFYGRVPQFTYQSFSTRARALKLNEPMRLLAEKGKVELTYANQVRYTMTRDVSLVAGQALDLSIPQIKFEWPDEMVKTEVGPIARFSVSEAGKEFYLPAYALDYPAARG